MVDDELSGESVEEVTDTLVATTYEMPEFCCWAETPDEMCRAFIFQWFAGTSELANYEGPQLVKNMDVVFKWLRHGQVPRSHLKVVKTGEE